MWLVDLIWPKECEICGRLGGMVCGKCRRSLNEALNKCPGCYKYSFGGKTHEKCRRKTKLLGLTAIYSYKDEKVAKLIWSLKYEGRWAVLMDLIPLDLLVPVDVDMIACVPMGNKKHKTRGYNQAKMIALVLSEKWKLPVIGGLLKKDTDTVLANTKTAKERVAAVSGLYLYKGPGLEGKKILLVDDVFTSGATMNEVAKQLKATGAESVWGWSLAS